MLENSKPAYLYARYSSSHQREDSIDRQVRYGREMIERNGWRLVEELRDEAKSAFKGANRLAGSSLYEFERRAREGEFASGVVLVCENVDRLSRQGAKASARLIWSLNELGVDVATYHDGHVYKAGEDTELMDLFSVIIKGALGKEESAKKSKRSQAFWDKTFEAIKAGDRTPYSSQVPAWIDRVDGEHILNPHRATIVRQMYRWYCDGLGSLQILNRLNAMGELSWSSEKRYKGLKQWTPRYIHKVLTTRQAIGEYVTVKGETLATDFYPAVVDVATFNKAQAIRASRQRSGGDATRRSQNLLAMIAKCGECGKSATVQSNMTKRFGRRYWMRCNEARYTHIACQNYTTLNYNIVEETILNQVLPLIAEAREHDNNSDGFDVEVAEVERAIRFRREQIDNLVAAISGGDAPKALVGRITVLENEVAEYEAQLTELKTARKANAFKPIKSIEASVVEDLRDAINSDDPEVRFEARTSVNAALTRLIKRVDVNPNDTFTVRPDEVSWWTFDKEGKMLEGEYVP